MQTTEILPYVQRLFPSQIIYKKHTPILHRIAKALKELDAFPAELERAIIRFSKDPSICTIIQSGKEFFPQNIPVLITLSKVFLALPKYKQGFIKGTLISEEVAQDFCSSANQGELFSQILKRLKQRGKKQAEPSSYQLSPGPSQPRKRKHTKNLSQPN